MERDSRVSGQGGQISTTCFLKALSRALSEFLKVSSNVKTMDSFHLRAGSFLSSSFFLFLRLFRWKNK